MAQVLSGRCLRASFKLATEFPWDYRNKVEFRVDSQESIVTYFVVSVREVETSDVHTSVKHLDEHLNIPASWSEGANDLSLACGKIDLLENVGELNAGGIGTNTLYCFNHFYFLIKI